jgi:hypothetical protein
VVGIATTPEQLGLVGCWTVVALRRERLSVAQARKDPQAQPKVEIALYVTSRRLEDGPVEALAKAIRRHWGAIENGSHHRRDVTLGEDASRIRHRGAAQALATMRNLALGHEALGRTLRTAFKTAESGGDQATMDLLIGRMEASDKAAWMLRSHLENP